MSLVHSQATIDKVEFARSLVLADPSIRQGALARAVKTMFGSGLSPVVLSNLKAGRDPFEVRRRAKRRVQDTEQAEQAAVQEAPPEEVRCVRSRRIQPRHSRFLVANRGLGTFVHCEGKSGAKAEVESLLDRGILEEDVLLYKAVELRVETTFTVSFQGVAESWIAEVGGDSPPVSEESMETAPGSSIDTGDEGLVAEAGSSHETPSTDEASSGEASSDEASSDEASSDEASSDEASSDESSSDAQVPDGSESEGPTIPASPDAEETAIQRAERALMNALSRPGSDW